MKTQRENKNDSISPLYQSDPILLEEIFHRAVTCFNKGNLDEAAELFEQLTKSAPDNGLVHYNLGLVRYYQNDFSAAETSFRQTLVIDPNNEDALFNLGLVLSQTNQLQEAADCYLSVLESNPKDSEAHFNLGQILKNMGLLDEAISCFKETLKINPQHSPAHGNLGVVYHIQGKTEEAIAAYKKSESLDGGSPANRHILDALTGNQTAHPPEQYVKNLFDGYAARFEASLAAMEYEIPMLLRRTLNKLPVPQRFSRAVDLGCGTGLSGMAFRDKVDHLAGVDLSSKMLAVAQKKKIYNSLHNQDLINFLDNTETFYDLFVLTDVFVYLGDLSSAFRAIKRHSHSGTYILFSIELCHEADYVLRTSGRYAQSKAYIKRLAAENKMIIEHRQEAGLRKERGHWIDGKIYILQKI